MLTIFRNYDKILYRALDKPCILHFSTATSPKQTDEFRVLNLKTTRGRLPQRRPARPIEVLPPRCDQMPTDQDWGNVWPGPRSFHPATVPLPLRQGYVDKSHWTPPGKYGNAELMKIPNFLHLTPPVIKRQCEALKQFCTEWPKNLTEEQYEQHFPFQVTFSDYCYSSPSIRDPMSRIVTVQFKLASLKLDSRAKDKFLRLVGERYEEKSDLVTIVADRCPLRKQNYDYAMYLVTALYHESLNIEPWEEMKSEADMEVYIWENNTSRKSVEKLFGENAKDLPDVKAYANAVTHLMNEGESDYSIRNYGDSVRKLLNLPSAIE